MSEEKVSWKKNGSHNRLYTAEERMSELKEITQKEKRAREKGETYREVKIHGKSNEV